MKTLRITFLLSSGFFLFLLNSCEPDVLIPEPKQEPPVYDIIFRVPEGWPNPVYNFETNPLTEEGFRLGRRLFYEPKLSRDNSISCGSCHQQFAAFAHSMHNVSHGIDGLLGTRNSPALFNQNWHPTFMLDGGINHIEVQPLAPITNPVEMDEDIEKVVAKLQADAYYKQLFTEAFGDDSVTTQRVFKALAQFTGMLTSSNSKYDKYIRKEPGGEFNASEKRGLDLFRANCNSCHTEPLFSDFDFKNNGLEVNPLVNDSGRAHITGLASDKYLFKTPSLRNVEVTAPYMHDGRFFTLDQVMDHYSTGIHQTENLDSSLVNGIPLTTEEKKDIINFLLTLTDHSFLKDDRFKEPR